MHCIFRKCEHFIEASGFKILVNLHISEKLHHKMIVYSLTFVSTLSTVFWVLSAHPWARKKTKHNSYLIMFSRSIAKTHVLMLVVCEIFFNKDVKCCTFTRSLSPLWLLSSSWVSLLFSSCSISSDCVFTETASLSFSLNKHKCLNHQKNSDNSCRQHIGL